MTSPEQPQDQTEDPRPTPTPQRQRRIINVRPSQDGQFYYVVEGSNGEPVYTSETFTRQASAIRAARKEHEGRSNFDYILQYASPDVQSDPIRETLP